MQSQAQTPEAYLAELPADRREGIKKLRTIFKTRLPEGFEETMQYGMLSYVVPLSVYPPGYHRPPKQPLPFLAMASQKHFLAIYHMGLYAMPDVQAWFLDEYAKQVPYKLDMGKSCIRFKKMDQIPYELLGTLAEKISVQKWIEVYEASRGTLV